MINHPTVPAAAIGTATTAAAFIGQLGGTTTITVGEALTVFVFVATLVAWLARKLQKIEDDVERATDELEQLKDHINSRPFNGGVCLPSKKNE